MEAFAYQNKPENVRIASSGGAFQRLTEIIVKDAENYAIYGAVWNECFDVEHHRIDNFQEIGVFSVSKYLRSDFSKVLPLIKEDLKSGRLVIFSGTPCQIAGILTVVEKEKLPSELLYTIEIICHGTPEKKVWHDCLTWTERKFHSKISKVNFRDKRIGWKYYPTSFEFSNGKEILNTYESQLFIRLFMSSLVTTKGCFACPYANMNRKADITIGDFWGIEDVMPNFPIGKGVSLVLGNNDKGLNVINTIMSNLNENERIKKCHDDSFIKYQHNLNCPTQKPQMYDSFWSDYNSRGFEYVIKRYGFYTLYRKSRFLGRKVLNRVKR